MTEFHQPINPMRVITGDNEYTFTVPVFAIAISNSHDVEYLTINGSFYRPTTIKFAEVFINGLWVRLETRHHPAN
jgi:hypothetical protein